MQYFADSDLRTMTRSTATEKVQLLFYLVTGVFAQSVSSFGAMRFTIQSNRRVDAVEHVLTYSGTVPQVPYNQQLGTAFRLRKTNGRDSTGKTVFRHGGIESETERGALS